MLKVQEIRELIKLVDQSSIDEFTYEGDGATIAMKKNNNTAVTPAETVAAPVAEQEKTPKVEKAELVKEEKESQPAEEKQQDTAKEAAFDHEIVSPMVGTLYIAPNPESGPYVKVGSEVQKDTVVCIVEAMKLFNEIEAEVSGEITEILVDDGELVEYGQPLFRVKTK